MSALRRGKVAAGVAELEDGEQPMYVRVRARRGPQAFREVTTPEGIVLRLPLAPIRARAAAFGLDLLFISLVVLVVMFGGAILAAGGMGEGFFMGLAMMAVFVVRNFYFMVLELFFHGRTFGKKAFGLRVVSRDGAPLRAESLFVRNVTRDVEVFLPLTVIIAPEMLWANASGWAIVASSVWLLLFTLMPFFNKERLRIGDLLGGTVVITTGERVRLDDDLCIGTVMRVENQRPVYTCRPEQLDMYGVFELQVLEDVLRPDGFRRQPPDPAMLYRVAERIKAKIGWDHTLGKTHDWQFLHDFYSSLRARRERRELLGQHQPFKKEGRLEEESGGLAVPHRSGHYSAVGLEAVSPTDGHDT